MVPQIYRDIELILEFYTNRGWSDSLPKVWRFTIYPLAIDYILTMLSSASDGYNIKEGREKNILTIISNLNKIYS
jgi:hypothetical protein